MIYWSRGARTVLETVKRALEGTFRIEVMEAQQLELPDRCFNPKRKQYDANALLDFLCSETKLPGLWVISQDLYCEGMNFVFGYAAPGKAALLSTARLPTPELVAKEAVHEVGHVMGLSHCRNPCVMQYSNSLSEAVRKPSQLCEACERSLQ